MFPKVSVLRMILRRWTGSPEWASCTPCHLWIPGPESFHSEAGVRRSLWAGQEDERVLQVEGRDGDIAGGGEAKTDHRWAGQRENIQVFTQISLNFTSCDVAE